MSDKERKRTLENALGKLLGFEEGEAEDLLEHLFTIESEEDLFEYLVQLLGGKSPEMVDFVQNMSRYRVGDPLSTKGAQNDEEKEYSKKAAAVSSGQDTEALDSFQAIAMGTNRKTSKKSAGRNHTKQKQGNKSRVPPPKNVNNRKKSPPATATSAGDVSQSGQNEPSSSHSYKNKFPLQHESNEQQKQLKHNTANVEKSTPKRGKAKVVCGCFGTKHKALTNCLYCGRISCEAEGYDFCPFCGFMVEPPMGGSNGKAYLQKERLLRFDREFARRTEVFDDQADYQGPSTWMTEEEQQEAEDNQQKHLESLKRPKQTIKLAIY